MYIGQFNVIDLAEYPRFLELIEIGNISKNIFVYYLVRRDSAVSRKFLVRVGKLIRTFTLDRRV